MRAVLQRVTEARVSVKPDYQRAIGPGLLVLLGVEADDNEADIEWLAQKIIQLRIFNDDNGTMNLSVADIGGEILLVSQFTLCASTKKGTRPSWHRAAKPDVAITWYQSFHQRLELLLGKPVPTGVFGAEMDIVLTNHGPVTLVVDSRLRE